MSDEEVHSVRRDLVVIMAEIIMAEEKAEVLVGLAKAAELIEQVRLKAGGREC